MAGSLCHAIARHVADSGHMLKLLRARKMCSRSRKRLKGGQWTVDSGHSIYTVCRRIAMHPIRLW